MSPPGHIDKDSADGLSVHDDSWDVKVVNGSEGKTYAVKNGDKRYALGGFHEKAIS